MHKHKNYFLYSRDSYFEFLGHFFLDINCTFFIISVELRVFLGDFFCTQDGKTVQAIILTQWSLKEYMKCSSYFLILILLTLECSSSKMVLILLKCKCTSCGLGRLLNVKSFWTCMDLKCFLSNDRSYNWDIDFPEFWIYCVPKNGKYAPKS